MSSRTKPTRLSVALALSFLLSSIGSIHAAEEIKVKVSDFVKEMTIKGDLRLRQETRYRGDQHDQRSTTSQRIRHLQRMRLRLAFDFKLPQNFEIKTRLSVGNEDQVSTNQSFDDNGSRKDMRLDMAYLVWAPTSKAKLMGGKMANPFWLPYSGDVVWDGDYTPEGAAEQFSFYGPVRSKIFVNALQMVVDEDSAGMQDQAMFGQQIGAELLVFNESKFTVATALYEWVNERNNTIGSSTSTVSAVPGNRRNSSNVLLNEFRVHDISAEFATSIVTLPLRLQGTYIHNTKARLHPDADKGFQYGAILGRAGAAKKWEGAYFYKRVEADATVSDVADSDFGVAGGTNRKGHIFWISYSPLDFVQLTAKQFITKPIETTLVNTSGAVPGNRTQFDLLVKF